MPTIANRSPRKRRELRAREGAVSPVARRPLQRGMANIGRKRNGRFGAIEAPSGLSR
jgi:hypothetical protein